MKIAFRLQPDDDGDPPVGVETVWARVTKLGYELENVPFFARSATLGDVADAELKDGQLFYRSTLESSTNSLIRVVCYSDSARAEVREKLSEMGCSTESIERYRLVAVDLPAEVLIQDVRRILDDDCDQDLWDYEEPLLRGAHSGG